MKWFFAISSVSKSSAQDARFLKGSSKQYFQLAKVAVYSAKKNTSLEPYCIYDGEENEFTIWLREQGVEVIVHRSPHYEALKAIGPMALKVGSGAFLRAEIPKIMEIHQIPDEYILYTDVDVMFAKDVTEYLSSISCDYFAIAPEAMNITKNNKNDVNTGVMLMNVKNLLEVHKPFNDYIADNLTQFVKESYDQSAYQRYFIGKWDKLDVLTNWKTYWPVNPEAQILHFHGPKPNRLQTSVDHIKKAQASGFAKMVNYDCLKYTEIWQAAYAQIVNEEVRRQQKELEEFQKAQSLLNRLLTRVVEIKDIVRLVSKDSNLIWRFNIDSPSLNAKVVTEIFTVKGWIVGNISPVIKVDFVCNNQVVSTAPVNLERPDLERIAPNKDFARRSGFAATVELKHFQSEFDLIIRAGCQNGNLIPIVKIVCKEEQVASQKKVLKTIAN